MTEMKIILHDLKYPHKVIDFESGEIRDLRWASFQGGTLIDTDDGVIEVDENPNHVGLLAGLIEKAECATGSRSGIRDFYVEEK